jgi:hypothetical protein
MICELYYFKFNDGCFINLTKNWKMNPISEIKLFERIENDNKKYKKTQKNLGIFKGIKNQKIFNTYEIKYKNTILTNWRTKNFEFNFLNDFSYKDLLYNSIKNNEINNYKICGKDSENNSLYFPNNIECPINFIEISNNSKSSIDGKYNYKKLNLSDDLFLYYSNENIEGEILVQLKVSSKEGMCFNLKYDNDFAPYISNYNIKNKKRGCEKNLYDERLKIIDEDSIDNFLENNNIKEDIEFNKIYYNYTNSKIYLYKRGYIGLNESFKINEIKKVLNAPHFAKIKNFLSFFLLFFYFFLIYYSYDINCKYKLFIKIFIDIILFTLILSFVISYLLEIINYNIIKKILKSISENLFYKYNGNRWYIKMDITILFFLFIQLILRFIIIILFYFYYYYTNCNNKTKKNKKFYVPKELILKLFKYRIKLLEDKKHEEQNFIKNNILKANKKILKDLYFNNIKELNIRSFLKFCYTDQNLTKYLNLITNYKENKFQKDYKS